MKGLVTSNTHVQYESPITSSLKVMAKVKVFQKQVKLQVQGHKVKPDMCLLNTDVPGSNKVKIRQKSPTKVLHFNPPPPPGAHDVSEV